jgi:hypothetical protein
MIFVEIVNETLQPVACRGFIDVSLAYDELKPAQ